MSYYFNADKDYKTKPILVELTEEDCSFEVGTKAWFHREEDDLWIMDPDGRGIIEVDGLKYGSTLLPAHNYNFKPVGDSATKVGLDRINDLAFELMHIDELDDVFLKARRITEIVNQLLKEEAKRNLN